MQTRDNDDEALDPHPYVYEKRHDEEGDRVPSNPGGPKGLGDNDVAQYQQPEDPTVRSERAVNHHVALKNIATVISHKRFDEVAVGNDHPRHQHDVCRVIEITHRDQVLEVINLADRQNDVERHSKPGVNRTGYEVGW